MRIAFAGGGTGGHLFPGLALAEAIKKQCPDAESTFIGTKEGLETSIVPEAGYTLNLLSAGRGMPLSFRRPLNLPRFVVAIFQSMWFMMRYRPDVLVALGGYAAAGPGLAAKVLGVPIVVLEQNSVPGRVNRLLAGWARQIHLQFSEALPFLHFAPAEIFHSGSPMRSEYEEMLNKPPERGNALLITGGSQGARSLNDIMIEAIPDIVEKCRCHVIHVAGEGNEEEVREKYKALGLDVEVYGFADLLPLYKRARLAITRAGAGTIMELAALGIPALLVPLPTARDSHQRKNASVIVGAGGASILDQIGLSPDAVVYSVCRLWQDDQRLDNMSKAIRGTAIANAADNIAKQVISLAR